MACSNCHLRNGTSAFGNPWAVVYLKYASSPYSARSNRNLDMTNRINDCMLRSQNGKELPRGSYEVNSMIEYFKWLSTGMKVSDWTKVVGQGSMKVADMTRAADPKKGKLVYQYKCAMCHQWDGSGVWDPVAKRYIYPALWGKYSFNNGAGAYRLRTLVGFVKGNMPYPATNPTDPTTQLSEADAWDVTAYVNSNARPTWSGYLTDWTGYTPSNCMPNWLRKFVDAGYANYFPRVETNGWLGGITTNPQKYPANQHKYGPWPDMLTLQTSMQNAYLAITPRPVYPLCQDFMYDPATGIGYLR